MSSRSLRTLLAGSLCLALGACGGGAPKEAANGAGANGKKITIVMIGKSEANAVFVAARTGAHAAAADITRKTGVPVSVEWRTPPQEDPAAQAQGIQDAVAAHADGILVACSDADRLTPAIDSAVAQGVAVMTFDSDAPQSKRFAFYGVDDARAGAAVLTELSTLLGGRGAIAILAGNPDAPNLKRRVQGVKDEAVKHPGIRIVATVTHVETPQAATAAVLKAQAQHPEIKGWAMIGAWPLFGPGLLDKLPAGTKVVAVDALPSELVYVEKGVAPVLLAQPVYQWGYVGVQTIVDHLQQKPVPKRTYMELVRVTQQNLGEWARQLQAWGFSVPPKYVGM